MTVRTAPSLATFDTTDADIFFGRETICQTIFEHLQAVWDHDYQALSLIGAADSGKTSLVRAGVLPRLAQAPENWQIIHFSCCQTDIHAELIKTVLASLPTEAGEGLDVDHLLQSLKEQPEKAPVLLQTSLQLTATHDDDNPPLTLLVIDPLEVVFQKNYTEAEQNHFFELLQIFAKIDGIAVLSVLDEAYLEMAKTSPALAVLWEQSATLNLVPMDEAALLSMMEKTADYYNVSFEIDGDKSRRLDNEIAQAADGCQLSQLNYLLAKLYEKDAKKSVLTYQSYQDLEGLNAFQRQIQRLWQRYPANIHVSCRSFISKLSAETHLGHVRVYTPLNKLRQTPRQRHLCEDMQKYGLLHADANKRVRLNYPVFSALQSCAIQQDTSNIAPIAVAKPDPKPSVAATAAPPSPKPVMPDLQNSHSPNCDTVAEEVHKGMRLLMWTIRLFVLFLLIVFVWAVWVNYIDPAEEPTVYNTPIERNTEKDQVVTNEQLRVSDSPRASQNEISIETLNRPSLDADEALFDNQGHSSEFYLSTIEDYKKQWQKTPTLLIEKALMDNYIALGKAHERENKAIYASTAYRNASDYANTVLRKDRSASVLASVADLQESLGDLLKKDGDVQAAWQAYQQAYSLRQSQWQLGVTTELQQDLHDLRQKMLNINQ